MELEDNKRRRRVSEEEEAALLAVASPVLRSMIIAALDTGMRRGEMLALRFGDIDWKRRLIVLRGTTTKSRKTRIVPIGTSRLLSVLQWLRLDSTGADGEPLKTFKKAWLVAVLKAHGIDPHWRKGDYKDLTSECQQRFREINLHWHDMRHEYASRLVERGVPLAQVRDLLGHASILTTERYDNQKLEALQAAVERLERGKTFEPGPAEAGHYLDGIAGHYAEATEGVSPGQSFKNLSSCHRRFLRRRHCRRRKKARKQLKDCGLESW
jgi:integrase